jgi:NitT/TauT family transport system substrate-binding protein
MRFRKIGCLRWMLIVGFLHVALSSGLEAETQKIRISISSRSNTSVPYYVAVTKGFFREEGFDVEIIQANPRLGAMVAMSEGNADAL